MKASEPASKSVVGQQRAWRIDDAIMEVWTECREANWNGEGSEAVSRETLSFARELLEKLPLEFELPEVDGDSDGAVELFWAKDRQRLTAAVYHDRTVVVSGRIAGNRASGQERLVDDFPKSLREWLTTFYAVTPARVMLSQVKTGGRVKRTA